MIPANWMSAGRFGDDGAKASRTSEPFYEFRLDDMIPKGHLLRRINVFVNLHEQLGPFYSDIGRPRSIPKQFEPRRARLARRLLPSHPHHRLRNREGASCPGGNK